MALRIIEAIVIFILCEVIRRIWPEEDDDDE